MNILQRAALRASQLLLKSSGAALDSSAVEWYARNGFSRLYELHTGGTTYTGKNITVRDALKCSTVWVCTHAITDAISSMPLPLMQKVNGGRRLANEHPLYGVLQQRPNEFQDAQRFRRLLGHWALNYGRAYARIARRSGTGSVTALYPIHPTSVETQQFDDGSLRHIVTVRGGRKETLTSDDVLYLQNLSDDGITGIGAVEAGRQAIAMALVLEQYGALFFARGGTQAGVLKKAAPFGNDEAREQFRQDFERVYGSIQNAHKKLILEGEWEFKPFSVDPDKAQFVAVREFMIAEICRYYSISPHIAGDLSRATFSNIEHLALEFIQYTLMPWMIAWEQAIYNQLLTPRERAQSYYAKHNANALMRGDFATRMQGYATMLQNGVTSINECRELEDWDPIVGGDAHHIQLNMQTVPGTGAPITAESGKQAGLVKVSDGNRKS